MEILEIILSVIREIANSNPVVLVSLAAFAIVAFALYVLLSAIRFLSQ